MHKSERLELFLQRLGQLKAFKNESEAFEILSATLNSLEDELTNTPYQPKKWQWDGRMYPPQSDNRYPTDCKEVVMYRSKEHETHIGNNGSIAILDIVSERTVFEKAGADGRTVEELQKTTQEPRGD